nr:MAG TPA: hypothetical protein [Caudoviricetes sp.]
MEAFALSGCARALMECPTDWSFYRTGGLAWWR